MQKLEKGGEKLARLSRKGLANDGITPIPLRKYATQVQPGLSQYIIEHHLDSVDVIVQTRIAGRIREGGIAILDKDRVQLMFGGTLHEPLDVVIIG